MGNQEQGCDSGDVFMPGWWQWLGDPAPYVELPGEGLIARGSIEEGLVVIESRFAVMAPNTEVTVRLTDGKSAKARTISTAMIRFSRSLEAMVEVSATKEKQRHVGGTLILAEGLYKRGTGITISKTADAKVRFRNAVFTGKLTEDLFLGVGMLGARSKKLAGTTAKRKGIRRITK